MQVPNKNQSGTKMKLKCSVLILAFFSCVGGSKLFASSFHLNYFENANHLKNNSIHLESNPIENNPMSMEDCLSRGKEAALATIKTILSKEEQTQTKTQAEAMSGQTDGELVSASELPVSEASAMPLARMPRNPLDAVEKFLLVAIALTGITLFCVLLTLVVRFMSMKKKISSRATNATRLRLLKAMQKAQVHSPSFFGVPSSEQGDINFQGLNVGENKREPEIKVEITSEMGSEIGSKLERVELVLANIGAETETKIKTEANVQYEIEKNIEEKNIEEKNQREKEEEDWETIAIRAFNQKYDPNRSRDSFAKQDLSLQSLAQNSKEDTLYSNINESPLNSGGGSGNSSNSNGNSNGNSNNNSNSKSNSNSPEITLNSKEIALKLQLARTYIEIDDKANALLLLEEALKSGNIQEKASAKILLAEL